uniref:Secreted protein n=1 Tax=Cryptomonas curvata TaxID=233186 RepID=A0A7S0QGI7_9CRYP|mmetsp:Transcript_34317/g.72088  ORF Transcript_34317/g.72088 Transcript_34317/m.72088 type:complete len:107 (+) Transcript_34317:2-322(+)
MSRSSRLIFSALVVGMVRRSRCFALIPQSSPVCGYSYGSGRIFKPRPLHAFSMYKIGKACVQSSSCSSQYDSQDDSEIISTTEEWLKQWVIGLQLCPWASSVEKNG